MTRARDVMTRRVLTVREQTPIDDAAALLAKYRFTALPVVDDAGFLVGIVSEADLHSWLPADEDPSDQEGVRA